MASHSTPPTITFVSAYHNYNVKYDNKTIETILTDQGAVVEEWVNEMLLVHANNPKVFVGLVAKWVNPAYSSYGTNKCSTLQLCIDTKCLILQLRYMKEIPQTFKNFLMNPRFIFMGVDEDISKLMSEYCLDCAKSEDIRTATINKYPRRFPKHDLDYLATQIPGLNVNRPDSEWSRKWGDRFLDQQQVLYASIVAYASYKIARTLFAEK